jgi:hypothetical protein
MEALPRPRAARVSSVLAATAALASLVAGLFFSRPAAADGNDPEAAVKAAYVELSALLYAPPSEARALEIAALIGRDTDFEELTRRSFGEPCPVPKCKDHWAELSNVERDEVRPIFEAVVTQQWTRELSHAFAYDIDFLHAPRGGGAGAATGVHDRDVRVRVSARQKGVTDPPLAIDFFFLANKTPNRLVDLEAGKVKTAHNQYKFIDRILSNREQGYAGLLDKLQKRLERDAGAKDASGGAKEVDNEVDPDPDADAAAPDPVPSPEPAAPAPAPAPPASSSLPWGKVLFGGLLTLGIGIGLGRLRRKR